MTEKLKSHQDLLNEIKALRSRLEEAEETIRAIRNGEVDGFVVAQSDKLHTLMLKGADYPYHILVDSMGEGAVTLIPDGTIFFCNSRFAEIVQSSFENLIGTPFQSFIPPEEQSKFREMVEESGQSTVRRVFRLQSLKGTCIPVQLSSHILETGDIEGITIVVTDLTDRKKAEKAQWEAEHKLNQMLQSMLDGAIVVDLSGKITFANPAAERILDIQKDEIIGINYYSGEWQQIDINSKPYSLDQHPLTIALRDQREANAIEFGIITPCCEIKWLSTNTSPLVDEKGKLYGAIATFRDVTEQKKSAEVFKEMHRRIAYQASLLDQVRNAVIATDMDGKIFYWNKFAEDLYLWKAEEVIGKPITEVNVIREEKEFAEKILELIRQTGYWEGEFYVCRKDGSVFPAHVVNTVIRDTEGAIIGMAGVSIDITERKQAENMLRASQERYRLISTVSSDYMFSSLPDASGKLSLNWVAGAFEAITGYKYEEYVAHGGWRAALYPDDLAVDDRDMAKLRLNQKVISEVRTITKTGKVIWVRVYAQPICASESKELIGIHGAVQDITESKQAEEKLRDSEVRYRRLFEAAQDGVLLLDADTGAIFDVNPYLVKMLGYTYEEFLGKKLWEIGTFQDIVASQLAFEELRGNDFIRYEDLPLRSKYGQIKNVEFISNVYWADNKKVIQCNIRDITERRQAEDEVRSRTQELKMLYELSRALAGAKDLHQVLDIVNRHTVENAHVTFSRIGLLEGDNLVIRAAFPIRDLDHDLFTGTSRSISTLPYCRNVLKGHKPVIVHAGDPKVGHEERSALLLDHVPSICLMPLRVGKTGTDSGHLLGMLILGEARDEAREPISAQKLSLIGGIGDQAASAIRRMLLHEETDRRLRHLSALGEIDRAITSNIDLKISLMTALGQVIKQLGVDAASVLLLNSSAQILEFFCGQGFRSKGIEHTRLRLGENHAGRAALEHIIVHVPNLQTPNNVLVTPNLEEEKFIEYYGVPLIAKGQVKGVLEIFNRTPIKSDGEWLGFLKALAEQASIAIDNNMLFDSLTRSNVELTLAYNDTIEGWSHALDLRDKKTEGHTLRVTEKTLLLAQSFGLREDELVYIRWGALLHDIGKMGIPDGILLKPGPLTDDEWLVMKKHPLMAFEMLSPIRYLRYALDIPYCHHEKWDGTGYPRGLKGVQIPLTARIFAVVDVWDALSSDRPYRPAWSIEKTIEYIQLGSGTHFDPQVVKTFLLDIA